MKQIRVQMPMPDNHNAVADFVRLKTAHRASAILRTLDRSPGHKVNNSVLLDWLRSIALVSTRDELSAAINGLERLGLIKTETLEGLIVLELSERGQNVALGRETADGVLQPSPECSY